MTATVAPDRPAVETEAKTRVVIVDDHVILLEGLATILAHTAGIEVVGVASALRAGIARVKETNPDVVIVDMALHDGNATELLRVARRQHLAVRIIVLTALRDGLAIAEALREGAAGYVLKLGPIAELVQAIRAAAAGERFLSATLRRSLAPDSPGGDRLLGLSRREGEIFRLSIKGETAKEIARKLFVSPKTVDTHRGNIKRKLGVRSTVEMIALAASHGFAIAPKLPT